MLRIVFLAMMVATLSACSVLVPGEFLLTKERMEDKLQSRFPIKSDKGPGRLKLKLTLERPALILDQDRNQIGLDGRFTGTASLISFSGDYIFRSKLRYEPKDRSLYLQDAKFDSFNLNNGKLQGDMPRWLMNYILNEYVVSEPIYRFAPDEMIILKTDVEIDAIDVLKTGIRLKIHTVNKPTN